MKNKIHPLHLLILFLVFLSISCGTLDVSLVGSQSSEGAESTAAEPTDSLGIPQAVPSETGRPADTVPPLPTDGSGLSVRADLQTIIDESGPNVAWSPDGKRLYLGGDDLQVINAENPEEILMLQADYRVSGFAVSPDGRTLAVIHGTDGVSLVDSDTGSIIHTLPRSDITTSAASNSFLAFTPDGSSLAVVIGDVVKTFDVESGEERSTIVAKGAFNIAISPDGTRLYSGGWGETITVWDLSTGEKIRDFGSESRGVNRMALSPDGALLVSGGTFDEPMILWETATGRRLHTFEGHSDGINSLAFSPDGRLLASASGDITIKLWEVGTGKELQTLTGHTKPAESIAISPDGKILASGSGDGTTRLWSISEGETFAAADTPAASATGTNFQPTPIPLSERAIHAENASQVERLSILDIPEARSAVFSPDGRWLIVAGRKTHFLDAATRNEIRTAEYRMDGLAVSPDGTILAAIGSPGVVLFDLADGRELRTLPRTEAHSSATSNGYLAFSPDSTGLAVVVGDVVKLFDVESGAERCTIPSKGAFQIAISPDGRTLYAGGWGEYITVWDIATGEKMRSFDEDSWVVNRMALSPDGSLLASAATFNEPILLWNTSTGRLLRSFSGHTDSITDLAFSPDGKLLFSASRDVTIMIWDTESGGKLAALIGHTQAVENLAVSPDGSILASTSYNDGVFLWGLPGG